MTGRGLFWAAVRPVLEYGAIAVAAAVVHGTPYATALNVALGVAFLFRGIALRTAEDQRDMWRKRARDWREKGDEWVTRAHEWRQLTYEATGVGFVSGVARPMRREGTQ